MVETPVSVASVDVFHLPGVDILEGGITGRVRTVKSYVEAPSAEADGYGAARFAVLQQTHGQAHRNR